MKTKASIGRIWTIASPILVGIVAALLGIVVANLADFLLLQVIVGNPTVTDVDDIKTGPVFDLFYVIAAENGYYPEPTTLNYILMISIGTIPGWLLAFRWSKSKRKDLV